MPRLLSLFLLPREEDGHLAFYSQYHLKERENERSDFTEGEKASSEDSNASSAKVTNHKRRERTKKKFGFFKTSAQSLERCFFLPGVGAKVFCL